VQPGAAPEPRLDLRRELLVAAGGVLGDLVDQER
jgi:hypothetical protein